MAPATLTLIDRLRAYERAFNEPDNHARAELLAQAVTEDVVVSPSYTPDARRASDVRRSPPRWRR
jgi:hypothetical protein